MNILFLPAYEYSLLGKTEKCIQNEMKIVHLLIVNFRICRRYQKKKTDKWGLDFKKHFQKLERNFEKNVE